MVYSPIIRPNQIGTVSHQTTLGVSSYALDDFYSPSTAFAKAKVLDLAVPIYEPNHYFIFDKSKFGLHGTITGAIWRQLPTGLWYLTFDGDDKIKRTIANFRSGDSSGTITTWFKADSGQSGALFSSADEAGPNANYIFVEVNALGLLAIQQRNADTGEDIRADTDVRDDTWHRADFVSTGAAYLIFLDGVTDGLNVITGADNGDWFADTDLRDSFAWGAFERATSVLFFEGSQALQRISSVALTATQILEGYSRERPMFRR